MKRKAGLFAVGLLAALMLDPANGSARRGAVRSWFSPGSRPFLRRDAPAPVEEEQQWPPPLNFMRAAARVARRLQGQLEEPSEGDTASAQGGTAAERRDDQRT